MIAMKVIIGADSAGYVLKDPLVRHLTGAGD